MNKVETEKIINELEKQALKRISKKNLSDYAEGRNYGIMLMFEIAKEIVLKHAEKGD